MAHCQHGTDLQIFKCRKCQAEAEDRRKVSEALGVVIACHLRASEEYKL